MIFGQGTFPDAMTGHHGTIMLFFWFSWGCILAAILYAMRPWLQKQGFGLVKSGEEARFKLSEYEITGKNGHHFQEISDQHPCSSCLSGSDGHGSVYTANCSGQRFFGCTGLLQCFLQLLWRNTSQIPKKQ